MVDTQWLVDRTVKSAPMASRSQLENPALRMKEAPGDECPTEVEPANFSLDLISATEAVTTRSTRLMRPRTRTRAYAPQPRPSANPCRRCRAVYWPYVRPCRRRIDLRHQASSNRLDGRRDRAGD